MGDPSRRAVRATYERIAPHFSRTRHAPWPEVTSFLSGRRVRRALDLGCGNGRHLRAMAEIADAVVGLDVSRAALAEAGSNGTTEAGLVEGDAVALPVRSSAFEVVVFVATLHHLPTRGDRIAALDELDRVLAPTGCALVSVWSVTDDRFDFDEGQDREIPWTLPSGDAIDRFYHIFDRDEFAEELEESQLDTRSIEESSGNWYATVTPDD